MLLNRFTDDQSAILLEAQREEGQTFTGVLMPLSKD